MHSLFGVLQNTTTRLKGKPPLRLGKSSPTYVQYVRARVSVKFLIERGDVKIGTALRSAIRGRIQCTACSAYKTHTLKWWNELDSAINSVQIENNKIIDEAGGVKLASLWVIYVPGNASSFLKQRFGQTFQGYPKNIGGESYLSNESRYLKCVQ